MTIDKQALRQTAESVACRSYRPVVNEISGQKIAAFIAAFTPNVALELLDELEATAHSAAVDHEAACSLVEENEELKRRIAELEIESSVNDAAIIELKQQYSRLQEARYDTPAVKDVIAERQRQQSTEGWTPEHDDEHCDGELALAASCYAENFALFSTWQDGESVDWSDAPQPANWPWSLEWWKPSSPRRDLVKACALILAEIERGDRAFATDAGEEG
ncbi:ead/Ea22-like family protein [Salmonella enterica]